MYEDASQPSQDASQPSDITERLNGLMSLARRRQAESEASLSRAAEAEADAAAARAELAEVKSLLASVPEPRMDANNPRKVREPADPDAAAKAGTWESVGIQR
jgi:hypothetical protein